MRARGPLAVTLAIGWVALQATLIVTAGRRPDALFGFRMFAETSTIRAHLTREIEAPSGGGTVDVDVNGGAWIAKDKDGRPHHIRWRDRVIEGNLATFDREFQASYSAAAQVARWEGALDDVAAHLDSDAETRRLKLDLSVSRNGREPVTYHFARAPRAAP